MVKKLLLLTALAVLFAACHRASDEDVQVAYLDSLCLYMHGDYGSDYWRIPALLQTKEGVLIAVCDKRKHSPYDLPQDIDIVVRRSIDGGRSWSDPATLAEGQGVGHGYGDAALVECQNGDVVCLFVGGNGLWQSSAEEPLRSFCCRSADGGQTWTEPEELTSLLWGSEAANEECRSYGASFFASGNALRLGQGEHKGRLLVAAAMRRGDEAVLDNFVVYSDDDGHSWQVSECAYKGGDEAKLVELKDGRVLMSVRQNGQRGYNTSSDGGVHWGSQGRWNTLNTNACNGDIVRLDDSTLLHTLPNSMQRRDVSLFVSHDEGLSWQVARRLVSGPSVYSSLTMLGPDTLACLVEKGADTDCQLWLYRFNRAWMAEK